MDRLRLEIKTFYTITNCLMQNILFKKEREKIYYETKNEIKKSS